MVLPLTSDPAALERYAHTFDGFLFPGGHDLAPSLYGEEPSEKCGTVIPQRDSMEQAFFPLALAARKPLLGICRGIQLFNVMLGGDLYQDIPTQCPSGVEHHETPPYDKVAHPVQVRRGTPLFDAVGVEEMGVNSYHHQGIRRLGQGLEVAATAPDGSTTDIRFSVKEKPRRISCTFVHGRVQGEFTAILLGGGDSTSVECTMQVKGLGLFAKPKKLLEERMQMLAGVLGA